ncbi:ABC transporter substrate-binding protein [Desulfuromonas thiophila]|uniref:MlaC/ttg2D family ABC transporter substrate-binding protein n=1 Tax=Desulfuromonas thiophila TaxID=57664 RepID=UPI0029F4BBA0|nr:ABC transporter substrate-binding protein [Desulfuromonas thiophila]
MSFTLCTSRLLAVTTLLASLLVALPPMPVQAAGLPAEEPTAVIRQTVDGILEQLRTLPDAQSRRDRISALVRGQFSFELMAQGAMGPYWHQASAQQRSTFVALFTELLEATYMGRITAYTNEQVRYGQQQVRQNRALVETYIQSGNTEIPIFYKLLPHQDRWQVYDVVIEEVSLVRTYRSSYTDILRRRGIPGLLQDMEQKLEQLRAETPPAVEERA